MKKLLRYIQTLRYLKISQIYYRLSFKLKRPKVDLRPAPPVGKIEDWITSPDMLRSYLGNRCFCFLNKKASLDSAADWNNPEQDKLWLYNLHYFDYLRQDNISVEEGNELISLWIKENSPGRGNGWEPYTLSLRIVNWIKWCLNGRELNDEARQSLGVQVRYLMQRLEYHLLANHLLANAKALVFAGMFFTGPEAEKWLKKGLTIYTKQLPEQILADGGHFERSAMYHSIILEDLLDLHNLQAPIDLKKYIKSMLNWLSVMTGPDGRIILFNDAAFGIALPPEILFEYARKLSFQTPEQSNSPVWLQETGYAKLTGGDWRIFIDAAPVGPDYQPGHAHADTLSFELFHRQERLLVDSGTGLYIDSEIRRKQRCTPAHNTICLDKRNSSDVWGAHRVARRADIIRREFAEGDFIAAHNGYYPMIHSRRFQVTEKNVIIRDEIRGRNMHDIEVFFHWHPECGLSINEEKRQVRAETGAGIFQLTYHEDFNIEILSGTFSSEFGKFVSNPVIRLYGQKNLPATITTIIEKISHENLVSDSLLST